MNSSDIIKERPSVDNTDTSQIYQLKYNNVEGDSQIGFKYSRYRDSNATDNESGAKNKNLTLNQNSKIPKKNAPSL